MWIMVGGPYTSGVRDEGGRQRNLDVMNNAALAIFEKGHVPIIGVNLALPIIDVAGRDRFDQIMMPISLAVAQRCDAFFRCGGPSLGADQECDQFLARGLPVFYNLDDVPQA
ncbi:hypothetical protein JI58_05200 [Marinosulfonomonas sp. PRT-SC04]|nr:hypothetical protein JI58_05200 [Marinosulfonomonas sp. PRT-SC04]